MLLTELEEGRITYSKDIFTEKDQTVRKNSNDFGQELCVAGVTFKQGFFTHASNTPEPTQITFDISGLGYNYFGVRVGIDDAQGNNGSCRFYIIGDGKVLCKTPVIYNYAEDPVYLTCSVDGVSELILRVDDGGDGYCSDWGVWGEPTLYKNKDDVPEYPKVHRTYPFSGRAPAESDTVKASFEIITGDTSAKIGVYGDIPAICSIKNLKTGKEWLKVPTLMPLPAFVGGLEAQWTFKGAKQEVRSAFQTVIFSFYLNNSDVTAESIWKYADGGVIMHHIILYNPGKNDLCITYAPTFAGILQGNPTLFTVARGGGTPGDTGTWTDEMTDGTIVKVLDLRVPVAFLSVGQERLAVAHTFGTGEIVVCGVEGETNIESGLGTDFKTDIPAGDSLMLPASFFATGYGTQDDFSDYLNNWLYRYNTPDVIKEKTWPHVMFNMWNSLGGSEPKSDNFKITCDAAKELGIDRIVLDYGWWDKLGEWDPSPVKWDGGMAPYGQYAKEKGLEYVMYFLFHNGNSDKEGALSYITHPEWFIRDGAIDEICDLGNKECTDHIKKILAEKLNEFGIPGYRSDFSPVALSSNKINRHKYGVDTAYWNYIGFHEILSYLQENVPDFTYENCCGGGYYKDYATMSYTSNIFSTDTYRVIDARRSFYDTSFCYPPCQIAPQISFCDANPAIWDSFELRGKMTYGYIYRSVMLGAMYLNLDYPAFDLNNEEKQFIIKQIEIYKNWIRPLVVNGKLYHVTGRPNNVNWDGFEYYDSVAGKGILFVFRPDNNIDSENFKIYGLDPDAEYYIRSEEYNTEFEISGHQLLEKGITVKSDRIYWSDLIYIQRALPCD